MNDQPTNPRPSALAGQWYPRDPRRLASQVDSYLASGQEIPIQGQIQGLVAPHAGHRYSGPVAGYAFGALSGLNPDVVAILSPMHHPYTGALLTTDHDAYLTPLGSVPVAQDLITALDDLLQADLGLGLSPISRDAEHAIEIELPFLQRALTEDFRLLPVMMRDQSANVARSLGYRLADLLADTNALLVASSDLSHFYSQSQAEVYDQELLRRIETFDPRGVLQAEKEGKGFACGRAAVAAVLWACRRLGADRVQLLHYATSGNVSGDYAAVVGYGAAAILK